MFLVVEAGFTSNAMTSSGGWRSSRTARQRKLFVTGKHEKGPPSFWIASAPIAVTQPAHKNTQKLVRVASEPTFEGRRCADQFVFSMFCFVFFFKPVTLLIPLSLEATVGVGWSVDNFSFIIILS